MTQLAELEKRLRGNAGRNVRRRATERFTALYSAFVRDLEKDSDAFFGRVMELHRQRTQGEDTNRSPDLKSGPSVAP